MEQSCIVGTDQGRERSKEILGAELDRDALADDIRGTGSVGRRVWIIEVEHGTGEDEKLSLVVDAQMLFHHVSVHNSSENRCGLGRKRLGDLRDLFLIEREHMGERLRRRLGLATDDLTFESWEVDEHDGEELVKEIWI